MKYLSFEKAGKASYGALVDDGVVDLSVKFPQWPTLGAALRGGALEAMTNAANSSKVDFALKSVRLLPILTDPGRILCVGANYKTHIAEMGREPPKFPMMFTRYIDSLVGSGDALVRPTVSTQFDYEGEYAFVIGRTARHVPKDKAMSYVAGYTCFMDGSIRDWQSHTTHFTSGKNFWRSGSMGPALVTADENPDPNRLMLETRLNKQVMQHASLSDLLFKTEDLIAYLSAIMPLQPGDVIATGTTGGVGAKRTPPVWMRPGDTIEVEITGLGVLTNTIVDET